VLLLVYISLHPWLGKRLLTIPWPQFAGVHKKAPTSSEKVFVPEPYENIAVALDFSGNDDKLLAESLRFLHKGKTRLALMHVVESPVARTLGTQGEDFEIQADQARLENLADNMQKVGFKTEWYLGMGDPASELARMINKAQADIVIAGSHGHSGMSDLIYGTVINNLRHQIQASLLVVPLESD
jgi:manganese transport protein